MFLCRFFLSFFFRLCVAIFLSLRFLPQGTSASPLQRVESRQTEQVVIVANRQETFLKYEAALAKGQGPASRKSEGSFSRKAESSVSMARDKDRLPESALTQ